MEWFYFWCKELSKWHKYVGHTWRKHSHARGVIFKPHFKWNSVVNRFSFVAQIEHFKILWYNLPVVFSTYWMRCWSFKPLLTETLNHRTIIELNNWHIELLLNIGLVHWMNYYWIGYWPTEHLLDLVLTLWKFCFPLYFVWRFAFKFNSLYPVHNPAHSYC